MDVTETMVTSQPLGGVPPQIIMLQIIIYKLNDMESFLVAEIIRIANHGTAEINMVCYKPDMNMKWLKETDFT